MLLDVRSLFKRYSIYANRLWFSNSSSQGESLKNLYIQLLSLVFYGESIIDMFSKAYTMAGGGVVPVLIVGLLWKKDRSKEFAMGVQNSKDLFKKERRTTLKHIIHL